MALFEAFGAPVRGWLVAVDDDGVARVDWPGNGLGPMAASSLVQIDAAPAVGDAPWPVLLVFDGAAAAPIVAGVLHRRIVKPSAAEGAVAAPAGGPPTGAAPSAESTAAAGDASVCVPRGPGSPVTVSLDGRSVSLQAAERIELRCGESSLLMTADGRVVIRGANLVSRATETHKIRGAAVLIN